MKLVILSIMCLFVFACGNRMKGSPLKSMDPQDEAYLKNLGDKPINQLSQDEQEKVKDIFKKHINNLDIDKARAQICHIAALFGRDEKERQTVKDICLDKASKLSDAESKEMVAKSININDLIDSGFSAEELLKLEKAYGICMDEVSSIKYSVTAQQIDNTVNKIEEKLTKEFGKKITKLVKKIIFS